MNIILKYIGQGSYIPGIPDRDLTAADVAATGMTEKELLKTGLYKLAQPEAENKAMTKNYPNKKKESEQ